MAEMTQSCKRQWAEVHRTRYRRDCEALPQIEKALQSRELYWADGDGYMGNEWGRWVRALKDSLKYESEHRIGPATDTTLKIIPLLQTRAAKLSGTPAGRRLDVLAYDLYSQMPPGATIEPAMPVIDGSPQFCRIVSECVRTLPRSIRQKIEKTVIVEMSSRGTLGLTCPNGRRPICIVEGQSRSRLVRTIGHEFGHVVLDHRAATIENENQAESWAIEHGF